MLPWPIRRTTVKRSVPLKRSAADSVMRHRVQQGLSLKVQLGGDLDLTRRGGLLIAAVGDASDRIAQWLAGKGSGPEHVVDLREVGPVEQVEDVDHDIDGRRAAHPDAF